MSFLSAPILIAAVAVLAAIGVVVYLATCRT